MAKLLFDLKTLKISNPKCFIYAFFNSLNLTQSIENAEGQVTHCRKWSNSNIFSESIYYSFSIFFFCVRGSLLPLTSGVFTDRNEKTHFSIVIGHPNLDLGSTRNRVSTV